MVWDPIFEGKKMEIVQIINDGHLNHSPWSSFISLDGDNHGQVVQDVVLTRLESNHVTPQYYIMDADGSIVPVMDGNNFTILTQELDDEVPAHKLDHMYAKKPKEPGSEVVKPARRRSKKKEMLKSHYFVQEIEESPPKINIIRGRHAMTVPVHNRPKILTSPQKPLYPFSSLSTSTILPATVSATPPSIPSARNCCRTELDDIPETVVFEDYEDFNAPSPGAIVTVCDGVELDALNESSRCLKQKKLCLISREQSPTSIENRNSSLDSIAEPEDDAELLLDFPMEEEVDSSIDVDFNEISMNSGNSTDNFRPITYYFNSCEEPVDDVDFIRRTPDSLPGFCESEEKLCSVIEESQAVIDDSYDESTNKVIRKKRKPAKVQIQGDIEELSGLLESVVNDDANAEETGKSQQVDLSLNVKALIPTRRSTRPIKTPSRLEDLEDIAFAKRKRR